MILELANVATSQLAELVTLINTSKRIEQYERENVKSQLAQQRMNEYGDL